MIFEMTGVIDRAVTSTFNAEVEADSAEQAKLMFEDVLRNYPDSHVQLKRLFKVKEEGQVLPGVAILFKKEGPSG